MYANRRITILPDECLRDGLSKAPASCIINAVIDHYGTSMEILRSHSRKLPIVLVRHMIHYLLSIDMERPFSEIARTFNLDHATALNSRKKIEDWVETSRDVKLVVIKISQTIIKNSMKPQIQIIGQVSGLLPADAKINFKEAQTYLEARGWEVWNPKENVPLDTPEPEAMRICLTNLLKHQTTAVGVLKNWTKSKGAKTEYMVANALGLKVIEL